MPKHGKWKLDARNSDSTSSRHMPKGSKIMTTTWAMKKKTNGKLRGRLNARGYEQVVGNHYAAESIAAPVMNPNSVRVMMILLAMNLKWIDELVDDEGAFLQPLKIESDYK